MVLNVADFFKLTRPRRRPMLNEIPMSSTTNASSMISTNLTRKQQFFDWFYTRPELNSPVQIRVDDTITEVDYFKPDGQSPLGRNKRLEALRFWDRNQLNERLKSIQFDRLTTGSGFVWKGTLTNGKNKDKNVTQKESSIQRLKEICERQANKQTKFPIKIRENLALRLFIRSIDEDLRLPRIIDYVPSSTVVIEHGKYEVKKYIQFYGGQTEEFTPKEIVHIPLYRINGKVDGWTPISSLAYEMLLIWAIKENMLGFFRNGGVPSKMFILPEEIANSENHQWLVQELMDKGQLQNRHGNLVLTGSVEVKELEMNPKDMEYKDLALYVTSNVAYALRVPVSRIPYMIGSSQSKGDAGGLGESGYWSMIESDQRTIEMHLNSQIFNQLGFCIRFKKRYKIDDLREAQAMNFRVDAVTKMQDELVKTGVEMNSTKLLQLLDLSSSDVMKTERESIDPGLLGKSNVKDEEVMDEPDKQKKNDTKRQAANNNPKNSNQTGT